MTARNFRYQPIEWKETKSIATRECVHYDAVVGNGNDSVIHFVTFISNVQASKFGDLSPNGAYITLNLNETNRIQ